MYTNFYTFQGIHGFSEVYPCLSHKQVHKQIKNLSYNLISWLYLNHYHTSSLIHLKKVLELYSSKENRSQQSKKGNILTILMKAGLFIKLAMSKLSPVPVCKKIISENYSNYYNFITTNWITENISPIWH